jgi:hypothetical protein
VRPFTASSAAKASDIRRRLKSSGVVWASADLTSVNVVPQTSTTASSSRCARSERERLVSGDMMAVSGVGIGGEITGIQQ